MLKFVLLGDSLTYGFAVPQEKKWSVLLQQRRIDVDFINKGICGDTTGGMLARFADDVKAERCKYVLIMGGINDLIAECDIGVVQGNLMAIAHQAYHEKIIPLLGIQPLVEAALICPSWRKFKNFNRVNSQISQLRQWILSFCVTFGIYYVDIYDCFQKHQYVQLFADGLHPNLIGNEIIADEVETMINIITANSAGNVDYKA